MILSNRKRSFLVGVFIILAYTMLVYTISGNKTLGFVTDILSGLSVIAIPLLLFPIFKKEENKKINHLYIIARFIEGLLMIIGGFLILGPSLESYRSLIYEKIHIWFFIVGAMAFYVLLFRTMAVPKFISVWGLLATGLLLFATVIPFFGFQSEFLQALAGPLVLNELFLAIWLMVKGIKIKK